MKDINKKTMKKLDRLSLPGDLKKMNYNNIKKLCAEIRRLLIRTVSKNGGHLASNLGTVELTVAIHRVFNSPYDKIVWDVGHQAYTHKILTGRLSKFHTIRKENGLSGFPRPEESPHDVFIGGHSSTSVSVACGIAEAMRIDGNRENYAVAVVGDGAMTGGMIYEGLNNGAKERTNLIVILNHNNMSISSNVGGLAKHLAKIRAREGYVKVKTALENILSKTPAVGKPAIRILKRSKDSLRNVMYHTSMFDDFGFVYLGPVDGHDVAELEKVLNTAKAYKCPVFVHVNTIKGKGYPPAEKNPGEYHGVPEFDMLKGVQQIAAGEYYSDIFGGELIKIAAEDKRICAITASMKYSTGLQRFASEFKERFFDVGIAEEHAVTFAASLAVMGKIPVFAVYSSFLQRSYDQLIHDAAICNTHIVLCIDRAGIVGGDGETHQGIFDVPMLATIPNVTIYSPACREELSLCLRKAIYEDEGIVCVRYPRGKDTSTFDKTNVNTSYEYTVCGNPKILIISYGRIYDSVAKVRDILCGENINTGILKLTRIFPVDREILNIAARYKKIFFFEESGASGGIAMHLSAMLAEYGSRTKLFSCAIKGFVKHASEQSILHSLNLDADSMLKYIKKRIS